MNYLMHAFLSGPDSGVLVGNLLGDFIKGSDLTALTTDVRLGVQLHRALDSFADQHPAVLRSQQRLPADWSRVAGIIMDVYYDHLLAVHWNTYSSLTVREYLDHVYELLRHEQDQLPDKARHHAQRMIETDFLISYCRVEGITEALRRISMRFKRGAWQLQHALPLPAGVAADIETDFTEWMQDAPAFATARLEELRRDQSDSQK